jgi:hypothetical protein
MRRFARQALMFAMMETMAAAGLCAPVAAGTACHASSGANVTPLIELYTSEGCDSCPPAERWLSSRFPAAGDRPAAIALAFHVDYWDRLGWVDRFARHAYTERQYSAMRANAASLVYTPQVLVQGRDFGWQRAGAGAFDALRSTSADTSIAIDAMSGEHEVKARVRAQAKRPGAVVDVAYVDSGLVSNIGAGENRGVRLVHDHVVRSLQRAGSLGRDGVLATTVTLPKPAERGTHPAIVAWVQREADGEVLQSLALPLDGCGSS